MTKKKAIGLAIKCIRKEIQRLAFDANLYDFYKWEGGKKYSDMRKQLREVITMLEEMV